MASNLHDSKIELSFGKWRTANSFEDTWKNCNKCTNGRTDNNRQTIIHWHFLLGKKPKYLAVFPASFPCPGSFAAYFFLTKNFLIQKLWYCFNWSNLISNFSFLGIYESFNPVCAMQNAAPSQFFNINFGLSSYF